MRLSAIQTAVQAAVNDYVAWQQAKIGRDINPDELIKRVRDAGAGRILHATLTPAFQDLDQISGGPMLVRDSDIQGAGGWLNENTTGHHLR